MVRFLTHVDVARMCHEANRAYCLAIGDDSQVPWDDAHDWQRRSAIDGVLFYLKNPDAEYWRGHDRWVEAKKAEGWKHGPVKDPEKREHPCMVSFQKLPIKQQIKDKLFFSVVHAVRGFVAVPS